MKCQGYRQDKPNSHQEQPCEHESCSLVEVERCSPINKVVSHSIPNGQVYLSNSVMLRVPQKFAGADTEESDFKKPIVKRSSDDSYHQDESDDNLTEPVPRKFEQT